MAVWLQFAGARRRLSKWQRHETARLTARQPGSAEPARVDRGDATSVIDIASRARRYEDDEMAIAACGHLRAGRRH